MPSSKPWIPPSVKSLTDVDVAKGVNYSGEPIEIEGIAAEGSGGGASAGDYWVQHLQFAAWRMPGGDIVEKELLVLRPAPTTDAFVRNFKPYTSHRVRVYLSDDGTRSVLVEELPLSRPDPELIAIGEELQKPVIVSTKVVGDVVLDRGLNWYEGEALWNGETVTVRLSPDEEGSLDAAIKTAEVLWADQAEWKRKVTAYAVQELLPLKNDNWRQDNEPALNDAQFIKRMTLQSVDIGYEDDFIFWHDDGDLFWGHSIEIGGNLKDGLNHADIPG